MDTRTWAVAAHLSALLSLFVGFPFVGPLVVYLVKRDDPFVRRHAAEALNFNLSVFLYLVVGGIATFVLIFFVVAADTPRLQHAHRVGQDARRVQRVPGHDRHHHVQLQLARLAAATIVASQPIPGSRPG